MDAIGPWVRAANLLLAALVVGAGFGVWLGYDPRDLAAADYVVQHQHAIRALNVAMPALGAASIVLTIASAVIARGYRKPFVLLLAAAGCLMAALLITRYFNQPINAIVMTWSPDAPPANWAQWRDDWWQWHVLRTFVAIAGLACLIVANVFWPSADAASSKATRAPVSRSLA